jgi:riboflavin biosynthesis pyrimidine reductase
MMARFPIQVIVSRDAQLNPNHRIFSPPPNCPVEHWRVLIVTTKEMLEQMQKQFQSCTCVAVLECGSGKVNFTELLEQLRIQFAVSKLDVSTGGLILNQLLQAKLIDEIRHTITGQLIGQRNSGNALRPSLFANDNGYNPTSAPRLSFKSICLLEDCFLFVRSTVHYP